MDGKGISEAENILTCVKQKCIKYLLADSSWWKYQCRIWNDVQTPNTNPQNSQNTPHLQTFLINIIICLLPRRKIYQVNLMQYKKTSLRTLNGAFEECLACFAGRHSVVHTRGLVCTHEAQSLLSSHRWLRIGTLLLRSLRHGVLLEALAPAAKCMARYLASYELQIARVVSLWSLIIRWKTDSGWIMLDWDFLKSTTGQWHKHDVLPNGWQSGGATRSRKSE